MAQLNIQQISGTGLTPVFTAVTASDTFANTGNEILHVKNGSGAAINVTVNSQTLCNQGYDHDYVVSVPAGGEKEIGRLPVDRFNDPATQLATVTYSATASVTAAVKRL